MDKQTKADKRIEKAVGASYPPLGAFALAELRPAQLKAYNAQHGTQHTKETIKAEIAEILDEIAYVLSE